VGEDAAGQAGTLHITTRRLLWIGSDGAAGFAVPFR
jgi:hypothetical protein